MMSGEFLHEGDSVHILVGQKGLTSNTSSNGAGGGGGTFVTVNGEPLIIAGGGGGGSYQESMNYTNPSKHGQITESGGAAYNCDSEGEIGGAGAYCGSTSTGAPGAGYYYENTSSFNGSQRAGDAFINGGKGGQGSTNSSPVPHGGFGGGGGAYSSDGGSGGGGGYSGGNGGEDNYGYGGGGGSFNLGENQQNQAGV